MIFSKLIKRMIAGLPALVVLFAAGSMSAAENPNVTVLAFGLFGAQSVFESEAKGAASIVAQRLEANSVIVRANTKTRTDVTVASIAPSWRPIRILSADTVTTVRPASTI